MKRKLFSSLLLFFVLFSYTGAALAIEEVSTAKKVPSTTKQAKNIDIAFVFDGPTDKNQQVLKTFQTTIARSLLPDYKADFPKELVFVGDWTEEGAANASQKALNSKARIVVSLGYMSSNYYEAKKNKNWAESDRLRDEIKAKLVITIDQYGLRDLNATEFNPVKQSVKDFILFKKLVPTQNKTAILMNENYYKTEKDWNTRIAKNLQEKDFNVNFVVIPISNDVKASVAKIPNDVDSVYVTPLFNLSEDQRKELYAEINKKKLPSFSAIGQEDVELGALLGTSTPDVDRKLAEATSFNIYGVLSGNVVENEKIPFFDDKIIFLNKDTAEILGYDAPLRLLNNAEIISHKELTKYNLGTVLDNLQENNLDIERKKQLVSAARRATTGAYLKYLPTFRIDLGYQSYNDDYAKSYSDVPTHVGLFTMALDQIIYSPDLVTNIIVKHKKLKFDKAEKALTEAALGLETGTLYIEALMFENMLKVQEEYLKEVRDNLAISRVRDKAGKCGKEEVLRWAGEVSEAEKKLLNMRAEYKNIKIHINKLLFKDQTEQYTLAPLTAKDPAFFTSDIHIIDHVRTPEKLSKFTEMLIEKAIYMSPETAKLKAAIAMKKAEMMNYAQKFILPSAKISLEYGSQFDRNLPYENIGHLQMAQTYASSQGTMGSPWLNLDKTSGRVLIAAQWKPIEGGQKIAEIARCKAELNELNAYLSKVNTEIEMNVRSVINSAISKYFSIEKSYKAMFAEAENYKMVKQKYLMGDVAINQVVDAQHLYTKAKVDALNSQYDFFKDLIWVQRALVSPNWANANEEAKKWINSIHEVLPAEPDFTL